MRISRSSWVAKSVALGAAVLLILILVLIAARQEDGLRREYAQSQVRNLALLLSQELSSRLQDIDDELRSEVLPQAGAPAGAAGPTGAAQLEGPLLSAQGKWVMRLSRKGASGTAARAVREVPVEELGAALTRLELGSHGAATLRTQDMRLVYRHPLPPGGLNKIGDSKISAELQDAVTRQPSGGEFVARTALDGVARVNAYRKLDSFPLVVLVGVAESDFPSGWARIDQPLFALAGLTLLTLAGAIWALQRASRRALTDAQQRHDTIVTHSNDAIMSKSLEGRVLSWNEAAERILGWPAQEMIGQSVERVIPQDRWAEEHELLARVRRGEPVGVVETVRLHRLGHRIPMAVTLSPIRDGDGQVVGASSISRDITQQKALEKAVHDMAYRDALTGLPNRRYFMEQLTQALALSRRSGQWHALVFIDLDSFKAINDRHGHEEGDRCLISVARRLVQVQRETDCVARLGGDEFVVLCSQLGTDEGQALHAVSVIQSHLRSVLDQAWMVGNEALPMGASIGTQLFHGSAGAAEKILEQADRRMYEDKQARRKGSRVMPALAADRT